MKRHEGATLVRVDVIQVTFDVIQGTFGVIQGTFGVIQEIFREHSVNIQ
jgi:hypothetical protein